ncbi:helix-turn-helix domain-containing protein [Cupriavidus pauculus]|uniref:helix-turn-helix domain-containing protein n=1 Tax=Cupriavidus pauculus TaxID=82633 RepID=UPI0034E53D9D
MDTEGVLAAIGQAIRHVRKDKALSQEELAHAAGIDRSHMGRIERGERNLTVLNLVRIAAAVGNSPSDILEKAGL